MRIARIVLGVAGLSLIFSTHALVAQNAPWGPHSFDTRAFGAGGFGELAHPVTGEPYTAVRKSTFVQTLANGTTIDRNITSREARDSSGRTYFETQSLSGPGATRITYRVVDPVNRTTTTWSSSSKQATVMHMPDPGTRGQWHSRSGEQDGSTAGRFHRRGPQLTVTQLGTRTIDGVEATGARTTITYAAGTFGNNQPITVVHEKWVSSDMGLTILETDTDPRTGTRTMRLTNIQRNEPDPGLFQAPQGYTVSERNLGQRD